MDKKIIEQIQALEVEELYQIFIKRIVELEAIWGLYQEKNDGWAVSIDEEKVERIVLWSESTYAKMNAVDAWKAYGPDTMDLYGFVENGIDELKEQGRGVSIMFFPELGGLEVDLDYLKRDLEEAIEEAYPESDGTSEEEN